VNSLSSLKRIQVAVYESVFGAFVESKYKFGKKVSSSIEQKIPILLYFFFLAYPSPTVGRLIRIIGIIISSRIIVFISIFGLMIDLMTLTFSHSPTNSSEYSALQSRS
jgi:hypothetical protein